MTLDEMRKNIRFALGLREAHEQPLIDQQIQRGVRDLLRRTSCFVQCIDADVPDGGTRIELAALGPLTRIVAITRGDKPQTRVTLPAAGRYANSYWQVGQILIFSSEFAVGEKLQFYAVPRPTLFGHTVPADDMQDDDDFAEEEWGGIPDEFQDAIELYACAHLGSSSDDGTSQMGGTYWIMYVGQDGRGGRISEIKSQVNRMSGQTLGPAQLAYRP